MLEGIRRYECFSIIPIGNVEEPILGQVGLEKRVHAKEIFNEICYGTICNNLLAANAPAN